MTRPQAPSELLALLDDPAQLQLITTERGWPLAGYRIVRDDLALLELSDVTVRDTDFQIADVQSVRLTRTRMQDCSVQDSRIERASLVGCQLVSSNFAGVEVQAGTFDSCALANVALEDVVLEGMSCRDVTLTAATTRGLHLVKCHLHDLVVVGSTSFSCVAKECTVERARVSDSRAEGGRWSTSSILRAALEGVALSDLELVEVDVEQVELRRAILAGVRSRGGTLEAVVSLNAREMTDVTIGGAHVNGLELAGLDGGRGVAVNRSMVSALRLEGLRVVDLSLAGSELSGQITLQQSNVDGLDLSDATIAHLRLIGGSLTGPVVIEGLDIKIWELDGTALGEEFRLSGRASSNGATERRLRNDA